MPDTFRLGTSGSYDGYTNVYLWSNTANWVGGAKPGNGGIATFNISNSFGNPTGVDDIANLYLDSLSMPQGYLAVVGTLQIGELTLGSGFGEIAASTLPGNSSAALTIDGLAGPQSMYIGADGPSAVTTIDATTDPGEYYAANDGGEIVFNPAPNANSYLVFGNAPGGYVTTFAFQNPGATVTANLDQVAIGDAIALPGSDVSSVSFVDSTGSSLNGTLTVVTNLGSVTFDHVYYQNDVTPTGYTVLTDAATGLEAITIEEVTCYVAGTKILTSRGERAVETLQIGDKLKTLHAGYQKIKWIGTRCYDGRFIAGNKAALPICIKRNAIAANIPVRDLFVSPGHAICIDGVLVHASRLVNGFSVVQAERVDSVTYYHIEMETHEIIFAENCPAETFMGEYFRPQFQNAAAYAELYPGEAATEAMCLPRLESGFQLHAIQQRLAARAGIVKPPVPAPGLIRGYVDEAGPKICSGWAQDIYAPEEPVCLDITVDGRTIGRVLANVYRADLYAAGLGSGCHGFEFFLPPGITGRIDAVRTAAREVLAWTESAATRAA